MLFLQLSTLLPLLPLNFLPFKNREHLLVLDSQLPSLELHMVHRLDDYRSLFGGSEVCKCQSPENSAVEVVVEGVGKGEVHLCHELHELLLLDGKGDVLDDNGGRDELIVLRRSPHALGASLQLLVVWAIVTVHLMLVGENVHVLLWHRGRHRGVYPSLDNVKSVCESRIEFLEQGKAYRRQPSPTSRLRFDAARSAHSVRTPINIHIITIYTGRSVVPGLTIVVGVGVRV
jgi:hypothetical protein